MLILSLNPLKTGQYSDRPVNEQKELVSKSQSPENGAVFRLSRVLCSVCSAVRSQSPENGAVFRQLPSPSNRPHNNPCLNPLKTGQYSDIGGMLQGGSYVSLNPLKTGQYSDRHIHRWIKTHIVGSQSPENGAVFRRWYRGYPGRPCPGSQSPENGAVFRLTRLFKISRPLNVSIP